MYWYILENVDVGFVNNWKFPDVPGIEDFEGTVMHTASWKHDVEYHGKRVAVIGNGSSGIQIVPNLQPHVERLDHYVRGPTWISFSFAQGAVKMYNPQGGNGMAFGVSDGSQVLARTDQDVYGGS